LRLRKRDRDKLKKLKINKPNTNTIIKKECDNLYICLSISKNKSNINKEEPIFSLVFLDSEERKFQTFYSPDRICRTLENNKYNK
jgi:hypothetical protein